MQIQDVNELKYDFCGRHHVNGECEPVQNNQDSVKYV